MEIFSMQPFGMQAQKNAQEPTHGIQWNPNMYSIPEWIYGVFRSMCSKRA